MKPWPHSFKIKTPQQILRSTLFIITVGVTLALLLSVGRVLAAYLGPDRAYTTTETTIERVRDPASDEWELSGPDGASCTINHTCEEHPSAERQEALCGWVADNSNCSPAYRMEEVTHTVTRYHPEATVASAVNCAQPGNNGWCRSGLSVNITGEEPLNGYQILVVEGLLNGINFACSGANCVIPINEDGGHSLEFWAISDYGDSSRKGTLNVKLDSQPPVADPIVSGTLGQNGWYTSPTVRLSLSASDATSGLALIQLQADGGDWQSVSVLEVNGEGQHTLAYRVQDVAGHVVAESYRANIDLSPPVTSFSKPTQDGITVREEVSLQGKSTDSASGVAKVEISLNGGGSWQTLSTDTNGNWNYAWDTTQVHNGKYRLMARAKDLAGWQGDAVEMTVHVQNEKPQISLPVQWMIWETIKPIVEAGSAPIDRTTLSVSDPQGRWTERIYEWGSGTPDNFSWDRQFGDGVTAPPGSYTVTLKAWDVAGNMSQARGEIVIPPPPTATQQPTSTDPVPSKTPASQATTTSVSERVTPTNEMKEKGDARTTSPVNSIRPMIRPTIDTQPQAHESSFQNQQTIRSNIRWGSAAAALAGAATAYALARKRRREAKERQRRKAKRRAARRVKCKPTFAGDLSDEEVRARIKAAGGNPNMDIDEARALIHNARNAAVVRAAKEKAKQQQVSTSKPTRPAGPILHLTAEDWLAAKGKYDKLQPPSEETMEQVGSIPASEFITKSTTPAISLREADRRATENDEQIRKHKEALRAYYEGRKAGEADYLQRRSQQASEEKEGRGWVSSIRDWVTDKWDKGKETINSAWTAAQNKALNPNWWRQEVAAPALIRTADTWDRAVTGANGLKNLGIYGLHQLSQTSQAIIEWTDDNQGKVALGIGVVAAGIAIVLTGGVLTLPVIGLTLLAAGGTTGLMTVGLNTYFQRNLAKNLPRNLLLTTISTGVIFGGWKLGTALLSGASAFCASNPSICAKAGSAIDAVEEGWLIVKGAYCNITNNKQCSAEVAFELHSEHMDGGMPGNTVAKEASEQVDDLSGNAVEKVAPYGDEAFDLLHKHGSDAADIIDSYGDEGVNALKEYGDDLCKALNGGVVYVDKEIVEDLAEKISEITGKRVWSSTKTGAIFISKSSDEAIEAAKHLKEVEPFSEEAEKLITTIARDSVQGSGNRVILGAWQEPGNKSYIQEALDNGGVFFDAEDEVWSLLEESVIDPWRVNEAFLRQQLEEGVERVDFFVEDIFKVLKQDPGLVWYRSKEIQWLLDNAENYGYIRKGNSWIRKSKP